MVKVIISTAGVIEDVVNTALVTGEDPVELPSNEAATAVVVVVVVVVVEGLPETTFTLTLMFRFNLRLFRCCWSP